MIKTASVEIKEITEFLLTSSICRNVSRTELPQNYWTIFNHYNILGYQFPSNLNFPREASLSPKLTERPPRPNAIKTVLETRSNQPSPLEGVVYIWCIRNVAINTKVTFVTHHWNDKTKPFIYILRMLHIVCKKWLAVSQTLSRSF